MSKDYLKKIKAEIRREEAKRKAILLPPTGPPVEKGAKFKGPIKYKAKVDKEREALLKYILQVLNIRKGRKGYDTRKEDLQKLIERISQLPPRQNSYFLNLNYMRLSRIKEYIEEFEAQDKLNSLDFLEQFFISDPIIMVEIKEARDAAEVGAAEVELPSDEEVERISPKGSKRKRKDDPWKVLPIKKELERKLERKKLKEMPLKKVHKIPGFEHYPRPSKKLADVPQQWVGVAAAQRNIVRFRRGVDKEEKIGINSDKNCVKFEDTKPWISDYRYTIVKRLEEPHDWTGVLSEQNFVQKELNNRSDEYSEENGWYGVNELFDQYLCRIDRPPSVDNNRITIFSKNNTPMRLRVAYVLRSINEFDFTVPKNYRKGVPVALVTPDNQKFNLVLPTGIKPGQKIPIKYISKNGPVRLLDNSINKRRNEFFEKSRLTRRELIQELLNASLYEDQECDEFLCKLVRKKGKLELEKIRKELENEFKFPIKAKFMEDLEANIFLNISRNDTFNTVKDYFFKIATLSVLIQDDFIKKIGKTLYRQFQGRVITPDILSGYDLKYLLPEIYNNPEIDDSTKDHFETYFHKQINMVVASLVSTLYQNIYPLETRPQRPDIDYVAGPLELDIRIDCVNKPDWVDTDEFIYYTDPADKKLYCITFTDIKKMRQDRKFVNPVTKNPLDRDFINYIENLDLREDRFILPVEEVDVDVDVEVEEVDVEEVVEVELLAPKFFDFLRDDITRMEIELNPAVELELEPIPKPRPLTPTDPRWDEMEQFFQKIDKIELSQLTKNKLIERCTELGIKESKCKSRSREALIELIIATIKRKNKKKGVLFSMNGGSGSGESSEGESSEGESGREENENESGKEGSGEENELKRKWEDWPLHEENKKEPNCKIKTIILRNGKAEKQFFENFKDFEEWSVPSGRGSKTLENLKECLKKCLNTN